MSQVWNKTEPRKKCSPLDSPAISIAFTQILEAFTAKLPRGFKNATMIPRWICGLSLMHKFVKYKKSKHHFPVKK